jgi:hypothetical protein
MAGFDPNAYNPAAAAQAVGAVPQSAPAVQLEPIPVQWTSQIEFFHIFVMVYGRPGTGKTTLAATAPEPFILSAEGGLIVLRKGKPVPYWPIDSKDRLKWALDELLKPAYDTIKTVVGDSITEIAQNCLRAAKKTNAHGMKAYGEMADEVDEILDLFRKYPKHVYLSAKEEVYPAEDGLMKAGPSFPGKQIKSGIGYIPDFVFRMEAHKNPENNQIQHVLRCKPGNSHEAKARVDNLAEYEYPDLTALFNKILG